jgi:hypothetical protein
MEEDCTDLEVDLWDMITDMSQRQLVMGDDDVESRREL